MPHIPYTAVDPTPGVDADEEIKGAASDDPEADRPRLHAARCIKDYEFVNSEDDDEYGCQQFHHWDFGVDMVRLERRPDLLTSINTTVWVEEPNTRSRKCLDRARLLLAVHSDYVYIDSKHKADIGRE